VPENEVGEGALARPLCLAALVVLGACLGVKMDTGRLRSERASWAAFAVPEEFTRMERQQLPYGSRAPQAVDSVIFSQHAHFDFGGNRRCDVMLAVSPWTDPGQSPQAYLEQIGPELQTGDWALAYTEPYPQAWHELQTGGQSVWVLPYRVTRPGLFGVSEEPGFVMVLSDSRAGDRFALFSLARSNAESTALKILERVAKTVVHKQAVGHIGRCRGGCRDRGGRASLQS
jgi:hypothetical protein